MNPNTREIDWNDTSNPVVRQAEWDERDDFERAGCDTEADLEDDQDAY